MSEQIKKWLSTLIIVALVAGVAWGRWLGHAEMKLWQDDYYRQAMSEREDAWPLGESIRECLASGKTWVTRWREGFYVVGCDIDVLDTTPAPAAKPSKRSKPIYDELWSTVPPLSKELRLSKEQAANPPLPTFTKEWVGHCLAGYNVYTCDGDGCKNTVPSPELSDRRKYECYGWNGVIIGVN